MSEELDRLKVDCATALANPQFTNWGAICNYIDALEAALKERGAGEVARREGAERMLRAIRKVTGAIFDGPCTNKEIWAEWGREEK